MADSSEKKAESKWVRITSRDGYSWIVERKVAMASSHLKDALSDDSGFAESTTNTCHLDERGAVAETVVEYLAYKNQYTGVRNVPDFATRVPPEIALEL
ncbi:hypothetical protein FRB90_003042 [Tulasnella sp. 427]|nr:hypothetical protein FRB90_003042 [Tulasnella sp. 427]